jgi:membrane-associated protease RseP (regulator of RpoE activity)
MRKPFLTALCVIPLLLGFSRAAQSFPVDPQPAPFGFPSEESDTSAYLGVDVSDITPERLEALKLKEEKGVEVTMVDQDAPAGKAGLKEHDVILSMNGQPLESGAQLRRMIHETPAGRVVTLGVSRDGQPLTLKVQLGDRQKEFSWTGPKAKDFHIEIPPIPNMNFEMPSISVVVAHSSARSGLMVENITPQLGEFFGVKNGKGVLIRSVEKGSRADKAGFRAGDVVIKINGKAIQDSSDFTNLLRTGSGPVAIVVMRDKKEQNLNLTLPERKDSGGMFEESDEDPDLGASVQIELSELGEKIAKLRPDLALASEDAKKTAAEISKGWRDQQKQFQRQIEQWQKEMTPNMKREQEKMKMEMEKLQHEMHGAGLDI